MINNRFEFCANNHVLYNRAKIGGITQNHWEVPWQGSHHLRKGSPFQPARQRAKQVSKIVPLTLIRPYFLIFTNSWLTHSLTHSLPVLDTWPRATWLPISLALSSERGFDSPRKTLSTSSWMAGISWRVTRWWAKCTSNARIPTASSTSPTRMSPLSAASEHKFHWMTGL